MVVSTSTQTASIPTLDAESQSYDLADQSFKNVEWKRLNRRKHHKDRVQMREESEHLEEDREEVETREDTGYKNGRNERDKWKFDRREFLSIPYFLFVKKLKQFFDNI